MPLPERCDVMVLGAGPAGASTAIALKRLDAKRSVVVLDAGMRQRPWHDETLTSDARAPLEQLGLWPAFEALEAPAALGASASWRHHEPDRQVSYFCRPGHGWRLDREAFSRLLREAAREQGVEVVARTRIAELRRAKRSWCFEVESQGRRSTLEAGFAVDATGRQAYLARRMGAQKVRFDRLVGAFMELSRSGESELRIEADALVEAQERGFWYAALRSPDSFVATWLSDADLAREEHMGDEARWLERFGGSRISAAMADFKPAGPPTIRAVDSYRLDRMIGDGWLAVGDAAATIDGVIAQGCHRVMASGIRAAGAILDVQAGRTTGLRRYQRGVEQSVEDLLLSRRRFYGEVERWTECPFWERRRERVTLAGDQLLSFAEGVAARSRVEGLGMHLPAGQLHVLCDLCIAPRLVQAVVSSFKSRFRAPSGFGDVPLGEFPSSVPPDRRILLALQFLVEQGMITAE